MSTPDLVIDDRRWECGSTGIYIRAKDEGGQWGSYDIAQLTRQSLIDFLRSRGGDNEWAENVVLILLGHEPVQ